MHNTHLLGQVRQLSQMYFTHLAPTLTLRNQPLTTINRQWESCMSCCTHFNTSRKTGRAVMQGLCFLLKYSLQVYMTDRWNPIFVFLLWQQCQNQRYLKNNFQICHWEAHATLVKPMNSGDAISFPVKLCGAFGRFQHRIYHVLPYAMCNLTVFVT